jgi:WD40 repeat protein
LHKEPGRRYGSAEALADDLERWLRGEPISARRVGAVERASLWCRRKPVLATLTGLAVALLAAVVVLSVLFAWQDRKSTQAIGNKQLETAAALKETAAALRESRRLSTQFALERGQHLAAEGDIAGLPDVTAGLLWMARAAELAPEDDAEFEQLVRRQLSLWASQTCVLERTITPAGIANPKRYWRILTVRNGDAFTLLGTSLPLYDTHTGSVIGGIGKQAGAAVWLGASADGRYLLSRSEKAKFQVQKWDAHTLQPVGKPILLAEQPDRAAFCPDGESAWITEGKSKLRRWDLKTGEPLSPVWTSPDPVGKFPILILSPDGGELVFGSDTAFFYRLKTGTGEVVSAEKAAETTIRDAAYSPDGRWFALAAPGISIADRATGKIVQTIPLRGNGNGIAFTPDSGTLLIVGQERTLRRWDMHTKNWASGIVRHPQAVAAVAALPDGRLLTWSKEGSVRVWSVPAGPRAVELARETADPRPELSGYLANLRRVLVVDPRRREFLSVGTRQANRCRRIEDGVPVGPSFAGDSILLCADFSPDGRHVLTGWLDRRLRLFERDTGRLAATSAEMTYPPWSVSIHPDGQRCVVAAFENDRHPGAATAGALTVWALPGLKQEPYKRDGGYWTARFGPGNQCAAAGWGFVELWNAGLQGEPLAKMAHDRWVRSVAFSPDGRRFVSTSDDRSAQVWDAASGRAVGVPMPHPDWVTCAEFSPDGKLLATGWEKEFADPRSSAEVCLWNAATGKPISPNYPTPRGAVCALSFTGRGLEFLTVSQDEVVFRWEIPAPVAVPRTELVRWAETLTNHTLLDDGSVQERLAESQSK